MRCIHAVRIGILVALFAAGTGYAATDDFQVRTLVGNDTTPPTVPGNVTATPVAISQIDLAWSSSTDNFSLAGYQVFKREPGTTTFGQIATTTATNYSDVGLTPSTTYSYYITAFDSAGNVSASSTVVATTTLASTSPPTPTTTSSAGGSAPKIELEPVPIELESLEVVAEKYAATLRYVTKGYVRSIVRWGESASYELGSLKKRSFSTVHEARITGLTPGTRYYFTIEGENHLGRFGVLTVDTFTTLPPDDTVPPANVSNLRAYIEDGTDILLEWENPKDPDFSRVRVLRNDRFYPSDTADGWLVYEGDDTFVLDAGAAESGTTQYYTVFSYDTLGNVSSGAVVSVSIGRDDDSEPDVATTVPEVVEQIDLSFSDLVFTQEGEVLGNNGEQVAIDGSQSLKLSVPYELLPEHLKTIIVEVSRPDGSALGAFLLRVDREHSYYTTTLAPFAVEGRFPIIVSVYDFKTYELANVSGELVSTIAYIPRETTDAGFFAFLRGLFDAHATLLVDLLWLLLLVLLVLLVWYQHSFSKE